MQFTFTMGDGDTPEQYRRVIAALAVLGDVSIEEATPVRTTVEQIGSVTLATSNAPIHLHSTGDSLALEIGGGLPADIAPPEPLRSTDPELDAALAEDAEYVEAMGGDPGPTLQGVGLDTASLGFGSTDLAQDRADLDAASSAPPPPPFYPPPAPPETDTLLDLDLDGLPWHADIHAGTKSRIGDGSLRKKPGVSAEQVEAVKAEQRRIAGLAPSAVTTPPPPPGPPAPPAPPAPPVGPPPPPAEEAEPTTATDLLAWAARRNLTRETLNDACQRIGLVDANGNGSLSLIMQKAEFVGPLYRELRS